MNEVDTRWLLVSVTTAAAAPSLRMQVWRKLKGPGALYLQQSVCLLPDRPAVASALDELRERVRTDGGRMRAVFAEVVESEADLERFRSWVAKIEARDCFGAPLGEQVHAELARAAANASEVGPPVPCRLG
ncbi:Chromate resistance protein ChrB [Streptomyces sp. NPDC020192]|uniref:Chromate resistance protein ChrB n=1 Tax=Streptomyces sp. NPDC020192 TaxID=3365066 RepID=UPI00379250DF